MLLGVPNLLVGNVYHVKNESHLLEVFIMRLFNRTLSINDVTQVGRGGNTFVTLLL